MIRKRKELKKLNSKSNTYQFFKQHVKLGNLKIDKNTMIFNMNAATDCPAYKHGYCTVGGICYARKAEKFRPAVLDYRRMQEAIWKSNSQWELAAMFAGFVEEKAKRGIKIEFFRYNESGDFHDLEDVEKLDTIAQRLRNQFGIMTFGYTACSDLFAGTDQNDYEFAVKMSGKFVPGFATTTVWTKGHAEIMNRYLPNESHPKLTCHMTTKGYLDSRGTDGDHFRVCPQQLFKIGQEIGWRGGDKEFKCMRDCCLCATPSVNVAFLKH